MNAYDEDELENEDKFQKLKKQHDMSQWKILNISDSDVSDDDKHITISNSSTKKNKSIDKKSSSEKHSNQSDTSKCEYKLSDIKSTLKVAELQKIAKDLKVSIETNGKSKTKNDLFFDIKTKISKMLKK